MLECTEHDRNRIFNLGYYTWVEQQGTPFELFEARRQQAFWRGLRRYLGVWDEMITDFNARAAAPRPAHRLRSSPLIIGYRCAVCDAVVDIGHARTLGRRPNAHVRRPVSTCCTS